LYFREMKPFMCIDDPALIDKPLIEAELKAGKEVTVQFSEKIYSDKILAQLNELCARHDESLCIRFYGHYSTAFDARTVLRIPDVKCLLVDCLDEEKHIQALTELKHLESLSLGVLELQDTEILSAANFRNLTTLSIGATKKNGLNLAYIKDYQKLRSLKIEGHTKNIEVIGELPVLEALTLHAIKKVPIGFVNRLTTLKTLYLLLGSRDNIQEIGPNNIAHLSVVRVRGFNDFSNVSNFSSLKTLRIEDEIQLPAIHFDRVFPQLTELSVINCKTLDSITGLSNLPVLDSLVLSSTNIDFHTFMKQSLPASLHFFGFYTYKAKLDAVIKAEVEKRGYVYEL
jgi:protein phosphatase 1 regulatory subunit 7